MSDLKEYIESDDPNYFWRLSSGDHENLLDTAIQKMQEAEQENQKLREALLSVSKNTCCDKCQEAALVAKQAIAQNKEE